MSDYTADITAYVVANFPTSDGYTTATQTQLIALGEACAALVDPAQFADEKDWEIAEVIEANTFFQNVPVNTPYYEQLRVFCEYCLNLAITANTPGSGGSKTLFGRVSQAGGAAPSFDGVVPTINTFGEVPVWARVGAGHYSLTFLANVFTTRNKISLLFQTPYESAIDAIVWYQFVSATRIDVFTSILSSDILTGAFVATPSDSVLSAFEMTLIQYL